MTNTGHFINSQWSDCADNFFQAVNPTNNQPLPPRFAQGGAADVDQAATAAMAAAVSYGDLPDTVRANFLRTVAEAIDLHGDEITAAATQETALPAARLTNERGRTVNQLRMFADLIEQGDYLDLRHDDALPSREPIPRPDLRLRQIPIGTVAVFGASNFPLAFSVAGGDTASALAAGCPVIVKGHPAHPHTSAIIASAMGEAITKCHMPTGVFSLLQGATPQLSQDLVMHDKIDAVGFTGSLTAGRALFDAACARPRPIPLYAEMGSINPIFLLPAAAAQHADIAVGWAQSLALGGGQFCTNPGVIFCPAKEADAFAKAADAALTKTHTMLTPGIADTYRRALKDAVTVAKSYGEEKHSSDGCMVDAAILHCHYRQWSENIFLHQEIFGPAGIVVAYDNMKQLGEAAQELAGQLTATLWLTSEDSDNARLLLPVLQRKAGRLLCNGFPTGVEVADAMMHGGPYPAATYPATSVGAMAIRRFLRPVCYQNFPTNILPAVLQ